MKVNEFCKRLEDHLASRPSGEGRIAVIVRSVHQAFRVREDEIAIFTVDREASVLCFVWPVRLRSSGFVPLSSTDSLAARTARDNRPYLNNRFAAASHASIFETIRLGERTSGKPAPIQKIISAPLSVEGEVVGIIQVCRKAPDPAQAGPNFSPDELNALTEIGKVVARYL